MGLELTIVYNKYINIFIIYYSALFRLVGEVILTND